MAAGKKMASPKNMGKLPKQMTKGSTPKAKYTKKPMDYAKKHLQK